MTQQSNGWRTSGARGPAGGAHRVPRRRLDVYPPPHLSQWASVFRRVRRLQGAHVQPCHAAPMKDYARRRSSMATSAVEGVLDAWAAAWLAHNTAKILDLY